MKNVWFMCQPQIHRKIKPQFYDKPHHQQHRKLSINFYFSDIHGSDGLSCSPRSFELHKNVFDWNLNYEAVLFCQEHSSLESRLSITLFASWTISPEWRWIWKGNNVRYTRRSRWFSFRLLLLMVCQSTYEVSLTERCLLFIYIAFHINSANIDVKTICTSQLVLSALFSQRRKNRERINCERHNRRARQISRSCDVRVLIVCRTMEK